MNMQMQNKYWLIILGVVSFGWLLCGCERLPALRAEVEPTVAPAPTLNGVLQVGEIQEVILPVDALQGWHIGNIKLNGYVLIGRTPKVSSGLVAVNLQTQQVTGIDNPLSISEWATEPSISLDRYYIWEDGETTEGKYHEAIYVVDLHSGEENWVSGGRWADVSGSIVVYAQLGEHPNAWDLYTKNLESGEVKPLAVRENVQSWPKIDGNWVTYLDTERININYKEESIYAHNLSTGEDLLLGITQFATQSEGGTYGIGNGRIVWIGWQGEQEPDTYGLHVFDTQKREVYTPANLPTDCELRTFHMAGDFLLFMCHGFQLYDLAQDQQVAVPYPRPSTGSVYLSEDYVAFCIQGDTGPHIVELLQTPGAELPTPLPPDVTPTPIPWRLFVVPIMRQ